VAGAGVWEAWRRASQLIDGLLTLRHCVGGEIGGWVA